MKLLTAFLVLWSFGALNTLLIVHRLGQKSLFKLPGPTLIFTPDPKSFYGIWEMQEGKVVSRCIYIRIWHVFAQKDCI